MPLFVKIKKSTELYFVALQKLSSWPGTCWSLYLNPFSGDFTVTVSDINGL